MKIPLRDEDELALFAVLMECVTQQTEMLNGNFKYEAKKWANTLNQNAKSLMNALYKQTSQETREELEGYYDFAYMLVRHICRVKNHNEGKMINLMNLLIEFQDDPGVNYDSLKKLIMLQKGMKNAV